MSSWGEVITIRLVRDGVYSEPCGFLPREGLASFWSALGVSRDAEERLQPEWVKGNFIPVSMRYPVTSALVQVKKDYALVPSAEMPAFLQELEAGREFCEDTLGKVVFEQLERSAGLAIKQGRDLSLSPFG